MRRSIVLSGILLLYEACDGIYGVSSPLQFVLHLAPRVTLALEGLPDERLGPVAQVHAQRDGPSPRAHLGPRLAQDGDHLVLADVVAALEGVELAVEEDEAGDVLEDLRLGVRGQLLLAHERCGAGDVVLWERGGRREEG